MRRVRDGMGEVEVPDDAYWGASTRRAVDNFPISGLRFGRPMVRALGLIKGSAARAAGRAGHLDPALAEAIGRAADEVRDGRLDDQFVVDVFQTGSGTSTHTNANEVIANRAGELLGEPLGSSRVHPNDHVNFGQSSNDVFPTAMHVAIGASLREGLVPACRRLAGALAAQAAALGEVVKPGRTHLMDAAPVTMGQVFGGYATQLRKGVDRLERALPELDELPLGGTAVGTGLNAPPGFAAAVIAEMSRASGVAYREAEDHFEAQSARDAVVHVSGAVRTVAVSLFKIANDVRWLASGPRTGLAELQLPALQPGSSIMPGKVNPVLPEVLMQAVARVIGADATVAFAGASGSFELNVMMPVMAHTLLEAIEILGNATDTFAARCVAGLQADVARCRALVEANVIGVTALNPHLGYDRGAQIAKEALRTGRTVREVVLDRGWMTAEELDRWLDPLRMTRGGVMGE